MKTEDLPKTLRVGSITYDIQWTQEEWDAALVRNGYSTGDELFGMSNNPEAIISIKPGMSESQMRDTLLHECLHCLYARGTDLHNVKDIVDLEEYLVEFMTPWLMVMLQTNPDVIHYLTTSQRSAEENFRDLYQKQEVYKTDSEAARQIEQEVYHDQPVPREEKCNICDGTGVAFHAPGQSSKCLTCDGSGKTEVKRG